MNESTTGKRIKSIRYDLMMNQTEFAKSIGIKQNTLSFIETDRRKPSQTTVKCIASVYSVHQQWILSGEGPKYLTDGKDELREMQEKIKVTIQNLRESLNVLMLETVKVQNSILELLNAVSQEKENAN